MPNWCECDLYIYGSSPMLEHFKINAADDNGKYLSEEPFLPYPEQFHKRDEQANFSNSTFRIMPKAFQIKIDDWYAKDGYNSGGYEWCRRNWGTKWGICRPFLDKQSTRRLLYRFECAWGPCTPIVAAMGAKYPSMRFLLKYFESGGAFCGRFEVKNGEVVCDESYSYNGRRGG